MIDFLDLEGFWFWGLVLIVGFPFIILLLNELGYFLIKRNDGFQSPLRTLRNYVLPLVAALIFLVQIAGFDGDSNFIKILTTITWILALNTGLNIINRLFFDENNALGSKTKIPQLFLDIFRIFLVLLGGAIVLSTVWGVDMGDAVTALGLGSFVLGLALQDTLGNLFSGIALVYERPFSVGDWIKVGDDFGEVTEMNWRAVRIRTREGDMIVIPHLMIGQGVIMNYSMPTRVHVIKLNVNFSYNDPPNKVKEALQETCINTPGILAHPEPEIKTNEYADSSIVYEVEFGIEDFKYHEEITDAFMTRVWYTAQRHNLTIPYPQMTLHQAADRNTYVQKEALLHSTINKLPTYLPITSENALELLDGSSVDFYGVDEYVLREGEKSASLYILLEGRVGLFVKGLEGTEIHINTIHEGDFFGEVALLSSRTNSMSARALTDIKILTIQPDEVIDMVSRNPKLAHQLDEVMDARRATIKKETK